MLDNPKRVTYKQSNPTCVIKSGAPDFRNNSVIPYTHTLTLPLPLTLTLIPNSNP